jgi:cytochrome c oxidase cbb3-type subunit III
MSDFINNNWSVFITVATVLGILACLLLLIVTGRKKVVARADNTTGHVWDGDLREMNNPLPMWWVGLFVLTIVFSAIYLVLYPGLGSNPGTLGWTANGALSKDMAAAAAAEAPLYAKFASMPVEAVAKDPQALAIGERLFMNNCSQCHGSDARGSKGFPNLTDHDWLYGGSPEQITATITNGRNGAMPPMAAVLGSDEAVKNVANYVLSLSGSPHDAARAAAGQAQFVVCAACHGPDGKGNQAIGSANLTDNIWLHGAGEKAIIAMIQNGKSSMMPAWNEKFSPEQIHVLTAYVWSLSNK